MPQQTRLDALGTMHHIIKKKKIVDDSHYLEERKEHLILSKHDCTAAVTYP